VKMLACDGPVNGTCEKARVNTAESWASASRFGVSPSFEPRNPMRSARVVSTVITMTFGGAGPAASAVAVSQSVNQAVNETRGAHRRITDMLRIITLCRAAGEISRWGYSSLSRLRKKSSLQV